MQTFLPYSNFAKSVQSLDRQRLGKQRVETMQIMQAIYGFRLITSQVIFTGNDKRIYYNLKDELVNEDDIEPDVQYGYEIEKEQRVVDLPFDEWYLDPKPGKAWLNHPAVRMWRGYEWMLLRYQRATVDEWLSREYIDTCWPKTQEIYVRLSNDQLPRSKPPWFGNEDFHLAHQSNLVRKDPEHYRPLFPDVSDNLPYIWPVA